MKKRFLRERNPWDTFGGIHKDLVGWCQGSKPRRHVLAASGTKPDPVVFISELRYVVFEDVVFDDNRVYLILYLDVT